MPRSLRVFLCHASQDKPAVWKLHRYLKQHGVKPWLDREDLLPGEDWEVEIPKALFASDVILVCLSKNSVNKEGFVQKEITFALDKAMEKPEGTIFIIPVKLEECEIPRRLTRYQWVDLSRADGRRRLLMGLNKRVNDLGEEVQQIALDDTRQRTPVPKTPKPEIKKPEVPIVSVPVKEEIKEEPKKEIPAKPFTKLLDSSSLFSKEKSTLGLPVGRVSNPTESVAPKKRQAKNLTYGFWGIGLLVLILGGFGLNYLFNKLPAANVTASATDTATPNFPTSTNVPSTSISAPIKTPIPMPTLGIGSTMASEKDGMTLLFVPAGEFKMGSNYERPVHTVYLDAFWIDRTEVTNAMYAKCVDAGVCKPSITKSNTHSSYYGNSVFDDYPVIQVDWNRAKTYCEWTGRRLPTEAEWEKAARGTDARTYPWGEGIDCQKANYSGCVGDTSPVGNYESGKSPYGVYDMAGNVWEWVNDWYDSAYYSNSLSSNPLGPESGKYHGLRGGSWNYDDYTLLSSLRFREFGSNNPYDGIGFRCARSP